MMRLTRVLLAVIFTLAGLAMGAASAIEGDWGRALVSWALWQVAAVCWLPD